MSRYSSLLLLLFSMASNAQDTLFFKGNEPVKSLSKAETYKVSHVTGADRVMEKTFNAAGQQLVEMQFLVAPDGKKIADGRYMRWFENGQQKINGHYNQGEFDGELFSWWPNGQLMRHDIYSGGELTEGKIWDEQGEEQQYFPFMIDPQYPGGVDALMEFLTQHLVYPVKARRQGRQGIVVIAFVVEKTGKVNDSWVIQSVSKELDKEALRVARLIPEFIPGQVNGENARFQFFLPINFALN
jgi:TonB family protein